MSFYKSGAFDFAVAVTPSDSTILNFSSLFVGGAGNVIVTLVNGTDVTFASVPAGATIPIGGTKVKAASTATSIVALW